MTVTSTQETTPTMRNKVLSVVSQRYDAIWYISHRDKSGKLKIDGN